MDYKVMCIQQGYVPPTCKMDGQLCWLLIQEGKDPCKGCMQNRAICNGRHAPYENENYRFGCFLDAFFEAERKKERERQLKIEREKAKRQQKHSECNTKVIASIVTDLDRYGKPEFEIKVNDVVAEKGYVTRCNDPEAVVGMVNACIYKYGVGQVQVEINGYGQPIYDRLCDSQIDIDIVPITYSRLRL